MLATRNTQRGELVPKAQAAALDAIASVLQMHLEDERGRATDALEPVLIQIDGPGKAELVDLLAERLVAPDERAADPTWTVIRFDAWQYQRLAPPWWWLVREIDRQLRHQFAARGRSVARRKRMHDYEWRAKHLARDLVPTLSAVPIVLVLALVWYIAGRWSMDVFIRWLVGVIGGLTTLGVFVFTLINGIRRLLVTSPANVRTSMPTSDPLADLQERYSFLIHSAGSAVALIVDNLDRCRGEYVVELLEGLETVLRSGGRVRKPGPLVAVLVPADRAWLCQSYVEVYKDFADLTRQPGRPFGLGFVDKVFDFALRLPRVALAPPSKEQRALHQDVLAEIRRAGSELEIRELVTRTEGQGASFEPLPELRLEAVLRIGRLEVDATDNLCLDTARDLRDLVEAVAPGPTLARQVRTAYCVQRTRQLLGGHRLDIDQQAIHRLGLWTILALRWPQLAHYLARHPDDVELLRNEQVPVAAGPELKAVFEESDAARVTDAWLGAELGPDDIRRFTAAPGARRTDSSVVVVGATG